MTEYRGWLMNKRPGGMAAVIAVATVALATCAPTALAQSAFDGATVPGSKEPPVPVLRLASSAEVKSGQVAAVKGTVNEAGLRFAVGGLSILQPVVVTLFAREPADDLTLTLFKNDWKRPRRTGATGARGRVSFTFRTEGGVNILVRSSGTPQPFTLVAWAGDEIHPSSMKPVIVTPAQFQGKERASRDPAGAEKAGARAPAAPPQVLRSSRVGWLGAGGLGLLVAVIGLVVFRRTRK